MSKKKEVVEEKEVDEIGMLNERIVDLSAELRSTRRLIFIMSKHVGADNALIQAGAKPEELHRLTARELKGKR